MQSIQLQLSCPTRQNRPWRLPRPLLLDARIGSSIVQIFRGAELSSDLKIVDGANIQLEKAEVRPSPLLLNLHTLIGQVDLGDRFRDSVQLPIEMRLARPAVNRGAQAVVQLMRSEQGWSAQINAMVDVAQGEVNQVFFDLPSSLASSFREPLDSNVPMMLWPSADSSRTILCVLPQLVSEEKSEIAISVRLPSAGASQSVTVPDIRMLGLSMQRPALALPKTVDGEEVRWTQVGRSLPDNWLHSQGLAHLDLKDYVLHEPSLSQFQAMWHSRRAEEQTAQVLLTHMRILADDNDGYSGEIRYWIDPHNQAYLTAGLPEKCELIGAQLGSQPIRWTHTDDQHIRLLLQPSYLPVQLKLFVRWAPPAARSPAKSSRELPLPELDARSSGDTLVALQREPADRHFTPAASIDAVELAPAQVEELMSKAWVHTLVQAAPTAADHKAEERAAWLPAWDPVALGIADTGVNVPKQFLAIDSTSANGAAGGSGAVRTSVFWNEYARLLKVDPSALPEPEGEVERSDESQPAWFRIQQLASGGQLALEVTDQRSTQAILVQMASAVGLLALSCVLWSVRWPWLKYRLTSIGELVWPLWLALAAATWWFLPVAWPSLVIGLCALIVLWRRYREFKRDRQFVLSPRVLR